MSARRLAHDVWLVGGAADGAYTSTFDCNQYLLWDGSAGLLIDAGSGLAVDTMLENVASVVDPSALEGVYITHYHGDHAGGAAALAQAGLPIFASPVASIALSQGDEYATQVARARSVGVYPPDYRLSSVEGVVALHDDELIEASGLRLRVFESPGHCDGHLVFGVERENGYDLFTGDTLFPGGMVSIQAIPDCRLVEYANSMLHLAEFPATSLFPGHGEAEQNPISATADLRGAANSFARLIPPPNFLNARTS